jgi:hypothetical protein
MREKYMPYKKPFSRFIWLGLSLLFAVVLVDCCAKIEMSGYGKIEMSKLF